MDEQSSDAEQNRTEFYLHYTCNRLYLQQRESASSNRHHIYKRLLLFTKIIIIHKKQVHKWPALGNKFIIDICTLHGILSS